jgi:hypothetical protein
MVPEPLPENGKLKLRKIDYYAIERAVTGVADECGDCAVLIENDNTCCFALIDVLGHGKVAHDVAVIARAYVKENSEKSLVDIMTGLHEHLKSRGARGAVAAICRLHVDTGQLCCTGIGNINVRIMGNQSARLVFKGGIIGYMVSSVKEQQTRLVPGDILVMTSDGVKESFSIDEYPLLLQGGAKDICSGFINQLGKENDDASCIVMRYGV